MQAAENIHLELSGYWLYRSIEFLLELVGPERLLFGSRLPVADPGATTATVQQAEISPEALGLVAGENLRRLLSWEDEVWADLPEPDPEPLDELHALALRGEAPVGQGMLDCHGHLGQYSHYYVPNGSPDELVREMDRLGVEQICIFSLTGVCGDDAYGNDLVAEARRRHPTRLVGFVFPGTHRPPEEFAAEIERGLAAGLRGIKLYTRDRERLLAACRIAERERLLVLNHDWGPEEQLLELARMFPHACLIQGHTSLAYTRAARQTQNVYMCTCPLNGFGDTERVVEAYGADRILFGSDMSDLPVQWGFGPVLYARIPKEQKLAILGGNLRRLLETHSGPRAT
jgi:hypothetical protein